MRVRMSQGSPDSNRHAISVALFGMLVLTLGMGIGRFLYTPMLPVLLSEGQFTFDQLSWIASANYAGYLAGSLQTYRDQRIGDHHRQDAGRAPAPFRDHHPPVRSSAFEHRYRRHRAAGGAVSARNSQKPLHAGQVQTGFSLGRDG